MADSEVPEGFFIELREATRMCIKNSSGQYIITEKNGGFKLGDTDPSRATLWEFWGGRPMCGGARGERSSSLA